MVNTPTIPCLKIDGTKMGSSTPMIGIIMGLGMVTVMVTPMRMMTMTVGTVTITVSIIITVG